jgi:hypothetical protein
MATKNAAALAEALKTDKHGGGYDYSSLTTIINDPDTTPEEREKAMQARAQNPWASGSIEGGKRLQDIAAGKRIAQDFIPEGSLGRLEEGRSQEIQDLINARRQQFDKENQGEGFSRPELQAQQDVATRNIQRQGQLAQRALRAQQARSGVGGGTALAQQQRAMADTSTQQREFQRDLLLRQRQAIQEDRDRQASRLGALETSVSQARANETAVRQFNLDQAARERFGQLSTALTFAGLGSQERGSQSAIEAQLEAARVSQPAKGGLLSKLF